MPTSQLLAVFAARGNPFRFSSRVPGGRSDVIALGDHEYTNAFKQKVHEAVQHLGPVPGEVRTVLYYQ